MLFSFFITTPKKGGFPALGKITCDKNGAKLQPFFELRN